MGDKSQSSPRLDTPSEVSPSRETKRLPFTSLSEVPAPKNSSKRHSESRSTSSESTTSQLKATSVSVLMSTSILVSSMMCPLVSSVWTSTSSSEEPERELPRESTPPANSEDSKESPAMRLSNGSPRRWLVQLFEHLIKNSLTINVMSN